MKIALDQGMTCTGAVAFLKEGIVIASFTGTKGENFFMRRDEITSNVLRWFTVLEYEYPGQDITHVALEEFVAFVPRFKVQSIGKLHNLTGYMIGRMESAFPNCKVLMVSKGTESKATANLIAKKYGLKSNQHVRDAFELGMLAGFINE